MVQVDTIKFRKTVLVSSCGLEKSHYERRVPLHEAPTKITSSRNIRLCNENG